MEPPIKILLVLPFFYPHRGGSQKYAEELYAHMIQLHKNIQIDVVCYNTDKVQNFEKYRGFNIYRVDCFNIITARFALPNPFKLIKLLNHLKTNNYAFVNTHIRFFDPTWWLWAYAKVIGAQSIFTGHVATHPVYQHDFVELVAKWVDLTVAKYSLRQYDHVTFTNKTAQEFFSKTLGYKYESSVVYGGVDTNFFVPHPKQDRIIPKIKRAVPNDAILITFVGRMIWTKGVTYLLDAAMQILIHNDKAIFCFAGPGELEEALKQKIAEANLSSNIFMVGNLTYDEVRNLLAISDIFVNPSHHNEGFPNTILEAGSSECFIIATDNAGTWEVIKNKETGILIPQKDTNSILKALEWALEHPHERTKIAQTFRRMLQRNFDWKLIAEQYYNLLVKWQK